MMTLCITWKIRCEFKQNGGNKTMKIIHIQILFQQKMKQKLKRNIRNSAHGIELRKYNRKTVLDSTKARLEKSCLFQCLTHGKQMKG